MKGPKGMLPVGCIKANDLQSLARALNRLEAWHGKLGGQKLDLPCLRLIRGTAKKIEALVQSGELFIKLLLKDEEWVVIGDDLIYYKDSEKPP